MSLTLYAHPFSSYCWKVQIPLDADGTPYDYRNVDPSHPGVMEELRALWPFGKFPVLVDDGRVIAETSCIIEHLQAHHPGPNVWIPDGEDRKPSVSRVVRSKRPARDSPGRARRCGRTRHGDK